MKLLFSRKLVREVSVSLSRKHQSILPSFCHKSFDLHSCQHYQYNPSRVREYGRSLHCSSSLLSIMDSFDITDKSESDMKKRALDETDEKDEESEKTRKKSRKQKKMKNPALKEASKKIWTATKHNLRDEAMECFRTGRDAGLHFNQGIMNSVLYLLVGGENWLQTAKTANSPQLDVNLDRKELDQWKDEIFEYMEKEQLLTDEMVYTAQARLAACLGNPDEAFHFVKKMLEADIPGRLRSFTPALIGFSEKGEKSKASEILQTIDACNLDLTELEFQLLLKACALSNDISGSYKDIANLLKRMGNELTYLEMETIQIVKDYFASDKAEDAFTNEQLSEKKRWLVDSIRVNEDGYSSFSGDYLSPLDLAEEDWDHFLEAFMKIAIANEIKGKHFETFVKWYDHHGPFNIVIDGANVAFHKQNYAAGHFSFYQVQSIIKRLEEVYPTEKALVVVHENRARGKYAEQEIGSNLLATLSEKKQLFRTPIGSNDDWYWLYAALKAKGKGLLISNDECRDHIFQLLTPKYFLRWKERHLVRFEFINGHPTIRMPSVYTPCTQQLTNGSWMLPYQKDGEELWLCAKPC